MNEKRNDINSLKVMRLHLAKKRKICKIGQRSAVSGQRSAVSGQRSAVSGQRSAVKLSLIIPCYNEEKTIETCIESVRRIASDSLDIEIVVVDDASTDNSLTILERLADKSGDLIVLKHEKNRGKGAALKTGILHASGDFVGIQDADSEYWPQDYLTLLKPCLDGRADVVFGSRYLRPDTRRALPFWHTWVNKVLTLMSNMFTNLDLTDMETCYKLFRHEIISKIAPTLREERFGFEPEITAKVASAGCRVYECAISYNPRSHDEGKKIGWRDGFRALFCILRYNAPIVSLGDRFSSFAHSGKSKEKRKGCD